MIKYKCKVFFKEKIMGIFGIFKNNKNTKSKKKDSVPEPKPLVNDPEPAKSEVKKPMASEAPKKQKNIAAPKAESKTKRK